MRRNKKNHADILIDVTSLLDVVFIILLIVITQISGTRSSVESREQEAEAALREAETQQQLYRDQIDSLENIDQYVEFISVVSTYDPDTLTDRTISVQSSSGFGSQEWTLKGEAVDDAYLDFSRKLTAYISENPERIIVLSLNKNDEDILYRDEVRIDSIFTDLLAYPNVRIKSAVGA